MGSSLVTDTENVTISLVQSFCFHQEHNIHSLRDMLAKTEPFDIVSSASNSGLLPSQYNNQCSKSVKFGAKLISISLCLLSSLGTKASLSDQLLCMDRTQGAILPFGVIHKVLPHTYIVHLSNTILEEFSFQF